MNLAYVFNQGNAVLIVVFLLLIAMSFASWYIIFWKGIKLRREQQLLDYFRRQFVRTPDWPRHISPSEIEGSIGTLIRESHHILPILSHAKTREERKEILSMHLSQSLDVVRVWLDRGLTILASVGSSAPFIGLFGTVWGIYGALTKIAAEGNAGLNVVAGPMGESLVATAIGLFAAIPAVLAYNAFVRMNRVLVQDLRHIAEQMSTYLAYNSVQPQENNENIKLVKGRR